MVTRWFPVLFHQGGRGGSPLGHSLPLFPGWGGATRVIGDSVLPSDVSWSPNGTQLATPTRNGVRLIDVATGGPTQVALNPGGEFISAVFDWSPTTNLLLARMLTRESTESLELPSRWKPDPKNHRGEEYRGGVLVTHRRRCVRLSHHGQRCRRDRLDSSRPQNWNRGGAAVGGDRWFGAGSSGFTLSGNARRLAFERSLSYSNFWLRDLVPGEMQVAPQDKRLTQSTLSNRYPAISPDGKWVAFVAGQSGSWKSNLYKMPIAGGPPTQLTFLESGCYGPAWSPDGNQIAFTSDQTGRRFVWIVSADGGQARRLEDADMDAGRGYPLSWAPGPRIVFTAQHGKTFTIDPDAGAKQALMKNEEFSSFGQPFYSPDGARIAVNGDDGLWVVSVSGGVGELRVKERFSILGWHPDGQSVIVRTADRQAMIVPLSGEDRSVQSLRCQKELGPSQ